MPMYTHTNTPMHTSINIHTLPLSLTHTEAIGWHGTQLLAHNAGYHQDRNGGLKHTHKQHEPLFPYPKRRSAQPKMRAAQEASLFKAEGKKMGIHQWSRGMHTGSREVHTCSRDTHVEQINVNCLNALSWQNGEGGRGFSFLFYWVRSSPPSPPLEVGSLDTATTQKAGWPVQQLCIEQIHVWLVSMDKTGKTMGLAVQGESEDSMFRQTHFTYTEAHVLTHSGMKCDRSQT